MRKKFSEGYESLGDQGPIQIPFEIRKTNEKIGKISNFEFLASKLSTMISNHEFRLANSNHLQSKSEKMHVRKMKFEIRNSKYACVYKYAYAAKTIMELNTISGFFTYIFLFFHLYPTMQRKTNDNPT